MGTNVLNIEMADSPDEAPKYERPEYRYAEITKAQVVGGGTVEGNPTVDLIFVDPETGQQFVAMITGRLICNVAGAVAGMRERTKNRGHHGQH